MRKYITYKKIDRDLKIIVFHKNKGKREGHKQGILKAKYDIIVFVDSDTFVDKNAFIELLKPFNDLKVGATTGDIRILNEEEGMPYQTLVKSILTKYIRDRNRAA